MLQLVLAVNRSQRSMRQSAEHALMPLAAMFVLFTSPLQAAEVVAVRTSMGNAVIEIRGAIEAGDLAKVQDVAAGMANRQASAGRQPLIFHLNTPGGDLNEAMKIGRFFRDVLASVESYGRIIVATGSKEEQDFIISKDPPDRDYVALAADAPLTDKDIVRNYSAGILMFLGAVKRAHRDNSDQRQGFYKQRSIPVMGIHRPYISKEIFARLSPSQAQDAYKLLETAVRRYMLDMGAPQSLVDRMFTRASNEIELIPADQFRTMYKPEESFLQEWLIAKCGATGAEYTLSPKELADFAKIQVGQVRSRMQDRASLEKPVFYVYPDPDFPSPYPEDLYRKVRAYNGKVHACQDTAVFTHQLEWARSVKK
jgi:hypothetical protein